MKTFFDSVVPWGGRKGRHRCHDIVMTLQGVREGEVQLEWQLKLAGIAVNDDFLVFGVRDCFLEEERRKTRLQIPCLTGLKPVTDHDRKPDSFFSI